MKKIIYLLLAIFTLSACSKEEEVSNSLVLENEFEITDDPNDPVQHERYLIYQEYKVPVYFNDTISARQVGTDWYGKPVIRYETVDLNWTFTSYAQDIKYKYDYLTDPVEQMNSLRFARQYLEICSPAMRPFSILLVDRLTIKSSSSEDTPEYHVGFRTLVFANMQDVTEEETTEKAKEVIQNMVISKVLANKTLCARFKTISAEKGWYNKMWSTLQNPIECVYIKAYNTGAYRGFRINALYYGEPYIAIEGEKDDFVDIFTKYYGVTEEDAEATRKEIVKEMGTYGFICCATDGMGSSSTPNNDVEDLKQYIKAMLYLGADKFVERYEISPLVMQKYTMLYDFIVNELKVEL